MLGTQGGSGRPLQVSEHHQGRIPRAHLVLSLVWTSCPTTSFMLKLHSLSPVDSFSTFSIGFFSINSIFSQHFLCASLQLLDSFNIKNCNAIPARLWFTQLDCCLASFLWNLVIPWSGFHSSEGILIPTALVKMSLSPEDLSKSTSACRKFAKSSLIPLEVFVVHLESFLFVCLIIKSSIAGHVIYVCNPSWRRIVLILRQPWTTACESVAYKTKQAYSWISK